MASFIDDNFSPDNRPTLPKPLDGYPTLAEHMSTAPEISIFRRFEALNRQNLLYLQAELTRLERQLRNIEADSAACDASDPRSRYSRDWEWMDITDEKFNVNPQWQLFMRVRGTLKEYNETLLQQVAVSSLPKPDAYDLGYLQQWLSHPSCGNFPLIGSDRTIWKETPPHDLLALGMCPSTDPFSRWVVNAFIPYYHRVIGHNFRKPHPGSHSDSVEYNSRNIVRAVSVIATILAAILIIAPVVVLYKISSMRARLGAMAVFTVIFSLCMTGLTSAKRSDIFAATAAFAAVQVVFIGSSISSS